MALAPLLHAALDIQIHACAALTAFAVVFGHRSACCGTRPLRSGRFIGSGRGLGDGVQDL